MNTLPSGWERKKLGDLMEFKNGLNFTKSDSGEAIKIVGVADFKNFTELKTTENLDIINVEGTVKKDELLCAGDLLFVRSNGNKELIGRCLYFPSVNEKLSFSGFTIRGRILDENTYSKYISIFSQSFLMKQQIKKKGCGTNISNLSQQILNDIWINLPPLSEQTKIADILSTWDKAIQTTEQLLENSQQQKKALMQQLLTGKKRLKGFSGEWRETRLRKLLIESRITENVTNDAGRRLTVRLNLKGIERREERGTEAENVTAHFIRRAGQFIYGKQNFHKGAFGIIPKEFDFFETSQDIPTFDFVEKYIVASWFYYFCAQEWFYKSLENYMTGTGSKRLNPKEFLNITLRLPSMDEQQKIAQLLSTQDHKIDTLQQKLVCLKQEKKALMQKLLSGKVRV